MWAALLALVILAACGHTNRADGPRVTARDITFQSASYRLEGTITSPDHRPASAGVLIIGGSGPIDRDGVSRAASTPPIYRWWAEGLSAAGFVVLRYDKRFLTYPAIDIGAFNQETQIADALAALAFLRAAPEVAERGIVVVGHSEGGTLAPIVATRAGAVAGVVVINSVVFPVDELLIAQLDANPNVPKATVETISNQLERIRPARFRGASCCSGPAPATGNNGSSTPPAHRHDWPSYPCRFSWCSVSAMKLFPVERSIGISRTFARPSPGTGWRSSASYRRTITSR